MRLRGRQEEHPELSARVKEVITTRGFTRVSDVDNFAFSNGHVEEIVKWCPDLAQCCRVLYAASCFLNASIQGIILNPEIVILNSGASVTFSYLQPASSVSVAGNRPAPFLFFPSEVGRAASVSSSKKRASCFQHVSCTCGRRTWRERHNETVEVRAPVAVSQGQMSGVSSK